MGESIIKQQFALLRIFLHIEDMRSRNKIMRNNDHNEAINAEQAAETVK
ncbi:MAG: hypothetical protein WBZ36_15660 [Candidatus Nitrosopolaris sp.]